MKINIIIPVLNEELRIESGIKRASRYLEQNLHDKYQITIIDNGSTDRTEEIAQKLVSENSNIKYIKLKEKGVGLALREGVSRNECEIIGYMDVDIATDLRHLLEVYNKFLNTNTKIVNGSRLLKDSKVEQRKPIREITSRGMNIIIQMLLKTHFTDAMCGFKFYRKDVIEKLIDISSKNNGWFFCAETLIRAEWMGLPIQEIPVEWTDDPNSKVKIIKLSMTYLKEILKLYREKRNHRV